MAVQRVSPRREIRALAAPPKPSGREAQASAETSVMPDAVCRFHHSTIIEYYY